MLQKFEAVDGQSIFDVCLNCYGTLDLLYKLLQDNSIDNVNVTPFSRQTFVYEDSLVIDQGVNQQFTQSGFKYATNVGVLGSTFYVVSGRPPIVKIPFTPNPPSQTNEMYQQVNGTWFTSGQDGTVLITPQDKDGNSMAGNDIVQVEREIKPLKATEYSWNKAQGILTLLGGVTVDNGQSLFIIYSKMVTP